MNRFEKIENSICPYCDNLMDKQENKPFDFTCRECLKEFHFLDTGPGYFEIVNYIKKKGI